MERRYGCSLKVPRVFLATVTAAMTPVKVIPTTVTMAVTPVKVILTTVLR